MKTVLAILFMAPLAHAALGTYEVPAQDSTQAAAVFTLKDVQPAIQDGKVQAVSFHLPADLVGPESNAVELKASTSTDPNTTVLVGTQISASCTTTGSTVQCQMSYQEPYPFNLQAKLPLTQDYLKQTYSGNPELLAVKMNLAFRFAQDPEGVVTFLLP